MAGPARTSERKLVASTLCTMLPCNVESDCSCLSRYASRRRGSGALCEAMTCPKTKSRWHRRMLLCAETDHLIAVFLLPVLSYVPAFFLLGRRDPHAARSYWSCACRSMYASKSRQPSELLMVSVARRKKRMA